MWTLNTITNNYKGDISVNYVVLSGSSVQNNNYPALGDKRTVALNIPYIGIVYFQDIGTTPLGPSKQTYGVLITLNEIQWVFRYEGNGALNVVVNQDGTLSFSSPNGGTIYPINFAGYLNTWNRSYYLTNVNGGGLGEGANVPIGTYSRTIGAYELFTIEWIDANNWSFAIHTADGKYVTVVGGGGKGMPPGANSNDYPIISTATTPGKDELVYFRMQQDGKYVIVTSDGYFWTATNGGGWGESTNEYPIHTDAGTLGGWQGFVLVLPDLSE